MSGNVDHPAAHELLLFIENDGDLYRQQYQPILKNLVTKQAKGVYDKDQAVKLWLYLVESGAKKYVRKYGSGAWHEMFNVPTRREVAVKLNEYFLTESALGAYASLLPKKYQPKEVRHAQAKLGRGGKKRSLKGTGAWNVYLRGKLIDTVFYNPGSNMDNDDVRRSLINHDGYDPGITVRQRIKRVAGKRRHPGLGVKVAAHRRVRAKVTSHKRHWPDVLPDTPKKRRGGKRRASSAGLIAAAKALKAAWK